MKRAFFSVHKYCRQAIVFIMACLVTGNAFCADLSRNKCLAAPSNFSTSITEAIGRDHRAGIENDVISMNVILAIGKYIFGTIGDKNSKLPPAYLENIIRAELGDNIHEALKISQIAFNDGVIYIPYKVEGQDQSFIIQIAKAGSKEAAKIKGTPILETIKELSVTVVPQIPVNIVPLTEEFARAHAKRLIELHRNIEDSDWVEGQLISGEWKAGQYGQSKDRVFHHKWEHSFVAVNKEGYPIGLVIAYERSGGEMQGIAGPSMYIHAMAVDNFYRRLGIGAMLMNSASESLVRNGFLNSEFKDAPLVMSLQTNIQNKQAQALYEGSGFTKVIIDGKPAVKGHDYIYTADAREVVRRSAAMTDKPSERLLAAAFPVAAVPCIDIGQSFIRVNFVYVNMIDGSVYGGDPLLFNYKEQRREVNELRRGNGFIENFLDYVAVTLKEGQEILSRKGIPVVKHIGVGATAAFDPEGEVIKGTATSLEEIEGKNLINLIQGRIGKDWDVSLENDGVVQVRYLLECFLATSMTGDIDKDAMAQGKVIGFVPGTGFGACGFTVNNKVISQMPGPQQYYDIILPSEMFPEGVGPDSNIPDGYCGTWFKNKAKELGLKDTGELLNILKNPSDTRYNAVKAIYEKTAQAYAEVMKAVYFGNPVHKRDVNDPEFWPSVSGTRVFILGGSIVISPEVKAIMDSSIKDALGELKDKIALVYQDDILTSAIGMSGAKIHQKAIGTVSSALLVKKNEIDSLNLREKAMSGEIVSDILVRARKAEREGNNLTIAIEADWVPETRDEAGRVLTGGQAKILMDVIDDIPKHLAAMGLDNVKVIRKESKEGIDEWFGKVRSSMTNSDDYSNAVFLTSTATMDYINKEKIKNISNDVRPFMAGVDPSELAKYKGGVAGKQLFVDIMEMLYVAMELACGKTAPNLPIIKPGSYDPKKRTVIFLPTLRPMDYGELEKIYKTYAKALESA